MYSCRVLAMLKNWVRGRQTSAACLHTLAKQTLSNENLIYMCKSRTAHSSRWLTPASLAAPSTSEKRCSHRCSRTTRYRPQLMNSFSDWGRNRDCSEVPHGSIHGSIYLGQSSPRPPAPYPLTHPVQLSDVKIVDVEL